MLRSLLSGMAQSLREAALLYDEEGKRSREQDIDDLDCGARVTTELRAVPKEFRAASLAFTAFAPKVFVSLRALRGCDSNVVRSALSAIDLSGGMQDGNGKSGAFFMFTPDRKYVIKTLTEAEKDFLLTILPHYYKHMSSNPNTLLPWFLGMYRMKAKGAPSKPDHTLRVVVMANVFDGASGVTSLDEQYDLKGSTYARTNSNPGNGPAKDLDWKTRERRMILDQNMHMEFERQLKVDVAFLESMNVMDYSLLLGVSRPKQENLAGTPTSDPKAAGRSSSGLKEFFTTLFKPEQTLAHTPCVACSDTQAGHFRQHRGGIPSARSASAAVYYCGIIDILQPFNLKKKIEMTVKGKVTAGGKDAVSCADPHFYGQRFLSFVIGNVLSDSELLPRRTLPAAKSKHYVCKA
jgi:1-phosphatidylinositol-4-phosphate 5-kinase